MQSNKKKIITVSIIVLSVLLLGGVIVPYPVAVSIYSASFGYRCTTDEEHAFDMAEFPELTAERHTFDTMQGHQLVGYLYQNTQTHPHALLVFAHGLGGGGQNGYMDIFNYFCSRGFAVFAYDATGNDESEGKVIGGLPQGFIDLDHAISYVQTLDAVNSLPMVLMGYSWGGLSVGNVLNYHPEVEAVASLAGWDRSMDMIEYRGCQMVGPVGKLLLPYVTLHEYITYGDYAFSSAIDGFENSDCDVFVVHGELDDTIPIEYGYDAYYEAFSDNPRFTFKAYPDRDHLVMREQDGSHDMALMAEIADFFEAALQN